MGSLRNNGDGKLMKVYYQNGIFTIWYERKSYRNYNREVKRVDNVFYVEAKAKHMYTEEDAIKMLEAIYLNMVYQKERERLREKLKERFHIY